MESRKDFTLAGISGALTILLILLLKTVDVADIGPEGTSIGLSHINSAIHSLFGVSTLWYDITVLLGVLSILVVCLFAFMGLVQLLKRRSFKRVDRELLLAGGLYAAVIVIYVFFEKVIINYRPVIMEDYGQPEASFPSSHTMIICVAMGSTIMLTEKYITNETLRRVLRIVCCVIMGITVAGRLLSGVHWFTDIIGAVLISSFLLSLFSGLLKRTGETSGEA